MERGNPYLEQVRQTLPRLLALFDRDRTSASVGVGDRFFWAWGLIDFPNGTFQGAANGLARLWQSGMWPYDSSDAAFLDRLDSIFEGARYVTRSDGSCEEAFPNEGSYCVTALVAFDLLNAIDSLRDANLPEATLRKWRLTVEPMLDFLKARDETHAIISNHLATAAAALNRWNRLVDDQAAEKKCNALLQRILDHQSDEGWFEEYGGADPGYETLCLHYLADVHTLRPEWNLIERMARSVRFLWHFAHPDGSFGGNYGSRNTRFYYPSGILALSKEVPEAAALSRFMTKSIASQNVVTLSAMDEPNLIPMFNSYCWAARLATDVPHEDRDTVLPCTDPTPTRIEFPQAGLLIDRGPGHYTIVSTLKGGAVSHFAADGTGRLDAGMVVRKSNGRLGSTHMADQGNVVILDGTTLTIDSRIREMSKRLPNIYYFLALRGLCATVFRLAWFREWVKRRLARWLVTDAKSWPVTNRRTIRLGPDLEIRDDPVLSDGFEVVENARNFVPIHMASQGYWQAQDERNPT